MTRGFFAIGICNNKTEANIGTLWRAASMYDAAFIFTVGARYKIQASDTSSTPRHKPLFHFADMDDLLDHLPQSTPLVGVELDERSIPLERYRHPVRACYLLGAEDYGLTEHQRVACHALIEIEQPKPWSMNVAVAGAMVMHHRWRQG